MVRRTVFFGRFFVCFSLRHILQHPGRFCLVVCGIALGAAVFTSVRLSVHASLNAFTRSMDVIAGNADCVIVQPGGQVDERIIARLLRHPAVSAAAPVSSAYVRPVGGEQSPFLLIGLDPILDRPLRFWQPADAAAGTAAAWLQLIASPNVLLVAEPLARQHAPAAGGSWMLAHSHRRQSFDIAGVLAPQGLANAAGGRIALADIATFQEFIGRYGRVDRIDVKLEPGGSAAELQPLLPPGATIEPASQTRESGRRMIRAYQFNLSILSFVSLFVGMFLVYSLVALNAASRRRELAIVLSVGGSPRFLFLLFLAEGAVFGVLGWLIALPLGTLGVKYMLHGVSHTISTLFVRIHVDAPAVSGWEMLLSLAATVAVSLLAALQPAYEAMQVSPKEALTGSRDLPRYRQTGCHLAKWGVLMISAAWPLSHFPGLTGFPLPGYVAVFLIVVGFSLLAPWGMRRLGGAVAPALMRAAGQPAFMAARYLRDSGTRTAISVGALITAVALFTALVIMVHSFRRTVEIWVGQSISGDLFVRPKMAEFNRYRDPFSPQAARLLRQVGSNVELQRSRRIYLHYGPDRYQFEAVDFDVFFRHGGFLYVTKSAVSIQESLIRGEGVIVSEVFSHRTGLGPGDRFEARISGILLDRPVLGVIRDYRTDGGIVFFSLNRFQALTGEPQWNGARFFFRRPPADPQTALEVLQQKIISRCGDQVEMLSGPLLRQNILEIFDETFAITTVLLVIALAVASLGITTTLAIRVLERSRQISTLLAVGAGRGQIRLMIFWEALLMIIAGEVAGLACGFFLSHLLVFVINKASFGWTFFYSVDWGTLWWSLPLIFLAALSAAMPAIQSVFRDSPAHALRV